MIWKRYEILDGLIAKMGVYNAGGKLDLASGQTAGTKRTRWQLNKCQLPVCIYLLASSFISATRLSALFFFQTFCRPLYLKMPTRFSRAFIRVDDNAICLALRKVSSTCDANPMRLYQFCFTTRHVTSSQEYHVDLSVNSSNFDPGRKRSPRHVRMIHYFFICFLSFSECNSFISSDSLHCLSTFKWLDLFKQQSVKNWWTSRISKFSLTSETEMPIDEVTNQRQTKCGRMHMEIERENSWCWNVCQLA